MPKAAMRATPYLLGNVVAGFSSHRRTQAPAISRDGNIRSAPLPSIEISGSGLL
jgi:hypothetical protein